jgi:hypothetical protein
MLYVDPVTSHLLLNAYVYVVGPSVGGSTSYGFQKDYGVVTSLDCAALSSENIPYDAALDVPGFTNICDYPQLGPPTLMLTAA